VSRAQASRLATAVTQNRQPELQWRLNAAILEGITCCQERERELLLPAGTVGKQTKKKIFERNTLSKTAKSPPPPHGREVIISEPY
jgi:hypothetical protein